MKEFFLKMVSGPDNVTPDLARVLFFFTWCVWALACFLFLYYSHDPAQIAGSFLSLFSAGTALLIGGASAVLIKHKTEPGSTGNPP